MSEFKGTTTQWQSDGRTLYSLQDSDHPRLDKENRFSAGFYAHKGCSDEELNANISLCVAAPDLLAVLQSIINLQNQGYVVFGEKYTNMMNDAIAKALGETK